MLDMLCIFRRRYTTLTSPKTKAKQSCIRSEQPHRDSLYKRSKRQNLFGYKFANLYAQLDKTNLVS